MLQAYQAPGTRPIRIVYSRPEDVPSEVIAALAAVRDAGMREMYDREHVVALADVLGHEEAARWLVFHRHLYFAALRRLEETRPIIPAALN